MARFEILDSIAAPLGEGPAAGDMLYELGMMYSIGRDVPVDLVSAHKWFNLAAMKGNADAIRLRREIAEQMSEAEIATAQRAARAWLSAAGMRRRSPPDRRSCLPLSQRLLISADRRGGRVAEGGGLLNRYTV